MVRKACKEDIDKIVEFSKSGIFLRPYNHDEVKGWIENDILIIATRDDKVIGLCFCKIMSCTWAMLDSFYVIEEFRDINISKDVISLFAEEIKSRNISEVSILIDPLDDQLSRVVRRYGFRPKKCLVWYDN